MSITPIDSISTPFEEALVVLNASADEIADLDQKKRCKQEIAAIGAAAILHCQRIVNLSVFPKDNWIIIKGVKDRALEMKGKIQRVIDAYKSHARKEEERKAQNAAFNNSLRDMKRPSTSRENSGAPLTHKEVLERMFSAPTHADFMHFVDLDSRGDRIESELFDRALELPSIALAKAGSKLAEGFREMHPLAEAMYHGVSIGVDTGIEYLCEADRALRRENTWLQALPPAEIILEKIKHCATTGALVGATLGASATCLRGLTKAAQDVALKTLLVEGAGCAAVVAGAGAVMYPAISVFNETELNRAAYLSKGKETVVYIQPKEDGNGASHVFDYRNILKLSEGKKLVVARVSSEEEFVGILNKHTNISHVWLSVHGSSNSITFDNNSSVIYPDSWPSEGLTSNAQVILESCKTGLRSEGDPLTFSERVQLYFDRKVTVIAATASIPNKGTKVEDGKVTFSDVWGKDVTIVHEAESSGSAEFRVPFSITRCL